MLYAEVQQRIGAYLIDAIVRVLLTLVFAFVVVRPIMIAVLVYGTAPAGPVDTRALWEAADTSRKAVVLLLFFVTAWVPSGLYYAALESSSKRATLGKMALELVTARTDGSKVSFLRAAARYFVKAVVGLLGPFGLAALLPLFGGQRRQVRRKKVEPVQAVQRLRKRYV